MVGIDNTTLLLLAILAALLLYQRFFSLPAPLVHPLLLGKQSEVSQVRKKGESGVYRSFATGQSTPLTVRPANGIKTVRDVVQVKGVESSLPRCVLDVPLSDEALFEIVHLLPRGLYSLFPTLPSAPILTLLPPSPSTSLPLLLLSIASPTPLIILPAPIYLSAALLSTSHTPPGVIVVHVSIVEDLLEQVYEEASKIGVIIVGDPTRRTEGLVRTAATRGMRVHWWEDIWGAGEKVEKIELPDNKYDDVHSYFYSSADGETTVVRLTHMNVTAGIAGLLSLFPADKRPSGHQKDVIASASPLCTPLGMTIALAAVYSGARIRLLGSSSMSWPVEGDFADPAKELEGLVGGDGSQPRPTILFISSAHLLTLLDHLSRSFSSHPFGALAARYKLHTLSGGHVSRAGWWESLVWTPMRGRVLGGVAGEKLRSLIVVGDTPSLDSVGTAHLLLSMPITRLWLSPFSAGPVLVSHYYDLQSPGVDLSALTRPAGERAHTGPPASNIEVVLKGPGAEGEGGRVVGRVWARGPGVGEILGRSSLDGWIDLGVEAEVRTNGTFVMTE